MRLCLITDILYTESKEPQIGPDATIACLDYSPFGLGRSFSTSCSGPDPHRSGLPASHEAALRTVLPTRRHGRAWPTAAPVRSHRLGSRPSAPAQSRRMAWRPQLSL